LISHALSSPQCWVLWSGVGTVVPMLPILAYNEFAYGNPFTVGSSELPFVSRGFG
jgi:hypothetical protein